MPRSFLIGSLLLWLACALPLQAQSPNPSPPGRLQPHKMEQARKLYQEGIAQKDSLKLAEAYYVYGRAYYLAGDHLTSENYFWRAIRIREKRGDSHELGMLYSRLCDNERAMRHYDDALRFAHISLAIFRRVSSQKGLLQMYSHLQDLYANQPDRVRDQWTRTNPDSAQYYRRKYYQLALDTNDTLNLAYAYSHFFWKLFPNMSAAQRQHYLMKAYAIYEKYQLPTHQIEILLELASQALAQKQLVRVRDFLNQAQTLNQKTQEYHQTFQLNHVWMQY